MEIHAREILRQRRRMEEILAEHTGQPYERVHDDLDRDFILTPEEAVDYGVVDRVVSRKSVVRSAT
jgi:ATP-dependent Clp protease protease subunit